MSKRPMEMEINQGGVIKDHKFTPADDNPFLCQHIKDDDGEDCRLAEAAHMEVALGRSYADVMRASERRGGVKFRCPDCVVNNVDPCPHGRDYETAQAEYDAAVDFINEQDRAKEIEEMVKGPFEFTPVELNGTAISVTRADPDYECARCPTKTDLWRHPTGIYLCQPCLRILDPARS